MESRLLVTIIFLGFSLFSGFSQSTSVSGKITDKSGEPLVGANIYIEGSYDGASSDGAGLFHFQTSLKGEQLLKASYIGYEEVEQKILLDGQEVRVEFVFKSGAMDFEEIVITAGAFEASGEKKREVLQPLDIVTTAGATADLVGVFNTLPGTQIVGEEGRLFVRGGEGYETKTFIDGMQVLGIYSPAAPNTPSRSRFSPFMFSGASFSTGGYSAEYGQALSSALILNSKYLATQNRLDVSLMSVGGDLGFTKAWEESSLSGKLQYTNIDPYFGLINQEIDWIDPPTAYEASLAYRKKIGDSGLFKWYGNGNYSSLELWRPDLDRPGRPTRTAIQNKYAYINGVFQDQLDGDWVLKSGVSLTVNKDRIGLDEDDFNQNQTGFHAKVTLQKELAAAWRLKFGSEYFGSAFRQEFRSAAENTGIETDFMAHLPALFVETDVILSKKLLARFGLRSEYASLSRESAVDPRFSLALKTGEHSQASAAFGTFRQAPVPDYLFVAPRLQAEKAAHYILNYQYSNDRRTFRIEGYCKKYADLVKFDAQERFYPAAYTNTGSGYARGFDLFWRDSKTFSGVDYWISYSYLDTERDYQDYRSTTTPGFASKHNFSLVYKQFIPLIKSQIGTTFRYASGRPYHNPNLAGFQNSRSKDYHDLSLNLSYLINQQIILHASATNVLGKENVFGYEFASNPGSDGQYAAKAIRPPAKRFLFMGLFITFSKDPVMNQLPNL